MIDQLCHKEKENLQQKNNELEKKLEQYEKQLQQMVIILFQF